MSLENSKKNKIKRGQLWQKKDTGVIVEILCKGRAGRWMTKKTQRKNIKAAHLITEYDLHRFYKRI